MNDPEVNCVPELIQILTAMEERITAVKNMQKVPKLHNAFCIIDVMTNYPEEKNVLQTIHYILQNRTISAEDILLIMLLIPCYSTTQLYFSILPVAKLYTAPWFTIAKGGTKGVNVRVASFHAILPHTQET